MPPEKSTPSFKTSKPVEHFSPLGDQKTPASEIPPCAQCGALSTGGIIERMADVHPQGLPVMDLTFLCKTCSGPVHFAVNSSAIWPYYEIVKQLGRGKLRLRRLSRDEASRRVLTRGR